MRLRVTKLAIARDRGDLVGAVDSFALNEVAKAGRAGGEVDTRLVRASSFGRFAGDLALRGHDLNLANRTLGVDKK
jgi:hypothetical protein